MKLKTAVFNKENRIQLISWGVALLLAIGALLLVFCGGQKSRKDVELVVLGDSIFAENGNTGVIAQALGDALQMKVYNGAMGGSGVAWIDENYDYLSLCSLVKGIMAGQPVNQKTTHINTPATEYFDSVVAGLGEIDFSKVKVLVLKYGLNDFHSARDIKQQSPEEMLFSFEGALRYSIEMLKDAYPDLRIVLVTPNFTWYVEQGITCEEYNLGKGLLKDYVDAMIALGKELDVEVVDQYSTLFPNRNMEDWQQYTVDGMHLNDTGKKLVAEQLTDYFLQHPNR